MRGMRRCRRSNPEKFRILVVGLLDRQFSRLKAPKWVTLTSLSSGKRAPVITGTYDVTIINARFASHRMIDAAKAASFAVAQVHGGVTRVQDEIDRVVGEVVRKAEGK